MRTITITQLKQERPEVRTHEYPKAKSHGRWDAVIERGNYIVAANRGPTERAALQSLCRAMNWDVEVVEDRPCPKCGVNMIYARAKDFIGYSCMDTPCCVHREQTEQTSEQEVQEFADTELGKAPTIRTVTVSELLKERSIRLNATGFPNHARWEASLRDETLTYFGPTMSQALQSLANAEGWNVKVVEDPEVCPACGKTALNTLQTEYKITLKGKDITVPGVPMERCSACGEEMYGGAACRQIEAEIERQIPGHFKPFCYCTRCGKLPDGCVCQDGVRLDGGPFDQTTVTDKTIPEHPSNS